MRTGSRSDQGQGQARTDVVNVGAGVCRFNDARLKHETVVTLYPDPDP